MGFNKAIIQNRHETLRLPVGIFKTVSPDNLQRLRHQKRQRVDVQRKCEDQKAGGVNCGEQLGLVLLPTQACSESQRLGLPAVPLEAFQKISAQNA